MKVLLDTSVLLAAMLPDHTHHAESHAWLSRARSGGLDFCVAGHSLAELYAVLTRLPRQPRIGPTEAKMLVETNVLNSAKVLTLTSVHFHELIAEVSQIGLAGGAVYDPLIFKAGAVEGVDCIVTLNAPHFQRFSPQYAGTVISPLAQGPP